MTTDFSNVRMDKKYVAKKLLSAAASMIGKKRIANTYEKFIKRYSDESTGFVGCLSSAYISKEQYPLSWFDNFVNVEFEDNQFIAIEHYSDYLTKLYGDFMKMPPVVKRKVHNITASRIIVSENEHDGIERGSFKIT